MSEEDSILLGIFLVQFKIILGLIFLIEFSCLGEITYSFISHNNQALVVSS